LTRGHRGARGASRITVTGEQLTDPQAMARFAEAQSRLTFSLQRLQEAYPELRANAISRPCMSQIEGTENRITIASATITRRSRPIIPGSAPSPT
jgi:LemA protein